MNTSVKEMTGMKKNLLGKTGIEVTELCFGALPMGPLQKNMKAAESSMVVEAALRNGINFIDTAQAYGTYEPIKIAIDRTGIKPVIASKSNKKTYEETEAAVEEALQKLGLEYIDIFHVHAARESTNAFDIFKESFRCLKDMKDKGKIKAVGISTHSAAVARMAAGINDIDIIFPIINKAGRGIIDGTREDMIDSIRCAISSGKGVYFMKALAGGSLIGDYDEAMKFVRNIGGYSSIAVGMVSPEEVAFNVSYFNGTEFNAIPPTLKNFKRALVSKSLCKGCGTCMKACPNGAICFDKDGKADIDGAKCLTCGYCTPVCPQFAIRIV